MNGIAYLIERGKEHVFRLSLEKTLFRLRAGTRGVGLKIYKSIAVVFSQIWKLYFDD